jgi:hypothetical protein
MAIELNKAPIFSAKESGVSYFRRMSIIQYSLLTNYPKIPRVEAKLPPLIDWKRD